MSKDLIDEILLAEALENPPQTQEESCLFAARYAWAKGPRPCNELEFLRAARGLARGLFGAAYETASEDQRWTWIDMCERAIREVAGETR